MDLEKLLFLLSDGEIHSGSELGLQLEVSRTSIWKAIPSLQILGVPVEVIKGKGYQIDGGLDLLSKKNILKLLSQQISCQINLDVLLSCSSTNDYLAKQSNGYDLSVYDICLAEYQTAGRGRRGRNWVSPFAKNIILSISFVLGGGVEALSGLSLVIGIGIAKALEGLGVKNVGLKWPNDVLVADKKIAGILLELNGEATTNWRVVCGVGLNVHMLENEVLEINQDWCSLNDSIACKRDEIAVQIIIHLLESLELFKSRGFNCFLDDWKKFDVLSGKSVSILPAGMQGMAKGINSQGALLVDSQGKIHEVSAGEVSVRKS